MKLVRYFLALMLVGTFAACVNAADKGEKKKKNAEEGATVGTLAEKPADAKEGVVAVLKTKKGDSYNLIATDAVAGQIAELVKKSARVRVNGDVTPDGIKVAKITEVAAKTKADK